MIERAVCFWGNVNSNHIKPLVIRSITDIQLLDLPRHTRENGEVVVAEGANISFAVARMFTVKASAGAERGNHAHRRCSQLMLCVHGIVEVVCDDGSRKRTFSLDRGNVALLVPPTIWNMTNYRQDDTVLVVLCDRPYEADDYIHDYSEFLSLRKAARP